MNILSATRKGIQSLWQQNNHNMLIYATFKGHFASLSSLYETFIECPKTFQTVLKTFKVIMELWYRLEKEEEKLSPETVEIIRKVSYIPQALKTLWCLSRIFLRVSSKISWLSGYLRVFGTLQMVWNLFWISRNFWAFLEVFRLPWKNQTVQILF